MIFLAALASWIIIALCVAFPPLWLGLAVGLLGALIGSRLLLLSPEQRLEHRQHSKGQQEYDDDIGQHGQVSPADVIAHGVDDLRSVASAMRRAS